MVDMYKREGYTGILITDHFLNGNTSVPREGIWEERVAMFCESYYRAKARGEEVGLDVFFGWEYNYNGADLLTYGLGLEFLLAHPDMTTWQANRYFDEVHAAGGFVIHAHPYRERAYMRKNTILLYPHLVDAIEVRNCGNPPEVDRRSLAYAEELDLPMTGGSDKHSTAIMKTPMSGIVLPFRCHTLSELTDAIRQKKQTVIDIERVTNEPLTSPTFAVKRV